ncbi:MAG: helix-turn-helix domain-containing protein [Clostridia bacterium]|nr:helix-turn-helix domain-containing protein [Clostridia bacterium]
MSYKHLTIEERCCIRKYYKNGLIYRKIAEMIGRSPSTISREINGNRSFMNVKPAYHPHTAQKKYLLRRSYCNMFFADPYCAWQKGSSENSNGLLRKFYPKCRNFS